MKNNYFNKLRELDRTYDFGDFDSPKGRLVTKRRAHKRSRQQLKKIQKEEIGYGA